MPTRPRRRAVGPAGATPPAPEPRADEPAAVPVEADDDERFLAERPPHHDREP